MTARAAEPMPEGQAAAFRAAHAAYRDAIDPHSPWANARLSVAVTAALEAGWSARAIGEGLGIERKRVPVIAAHAPVKRLTVPGPGQGTTLPPAVVQAFRRQEDAVNRRRLAAERHWIATVRAARGAGWSCGSLGALVGISGERIRSVAALAVDTGGVSVPSFDSPARPAPAPREAVPPPAGLTEQEKTRMRQLAGGRARQSRRTRDSPGGSTDASLLAARRASEELTAMIVAAVGRGISWAELDRACGYARGGARARAARHGYGGTWASVTPYRKTREDMYKAAGISPPARKEA